MSWLRLYTEVLDDPKVQRLPPHLFKTWINLLCLARRGGGRLPKATHDMAFALRMPEPEMAAQFDTLVDAGLFAVNDDGGPEPHNWGQRQYKSDHDGAERVARYRGRQRNVTDALDRNVTGNDCVTPPETETETETETENPLSGVKNARAREAPKPKSSRRKAGVPLPESWQPDTTHARAKGMNDATIEHEASQFRDHHLKTDSRFRDWSAAWRTWCGNWVAFGRKQVTGGTGSRLASGRTPDQIDAEIARDRQRDVERQRGEVGDLATPEDLQRVIAQTAKGLRAVGQEG